MLQNHLIKKLILLSPMSEELSSRFQSTESLHRVIFLVGLFYHLDSCIIVFLTELVVLLEFFRIKVPIVRD